MDVIRGVRRFNARGRGQGGRGRRRRGVFPGPARARPSALVGSRGPRVGVLGPAGDCPHTCPRAIPPQALRSLAPCAPCPFALVRVGVLGPGPLSPLAAAPFNPPLPPPPGFTNVNGAFHSCLGACLQL